MKTILHIVRKDLSRLRGWIIGWLVLLLLPLVFAAVFMGMVPLATLHRWVWSSAMPILSGMQFLFAYVIVIVLVQEDGPAGAQQFWLTRPIGRGCMLAAKALAAFVVVGLLPIVVALPWWIWCDCTVAQVLHNAAGMLIVAVLPMTAAGLVASLTDTLSRALLWTFVLVGAGLLAALMINAANARAVESAAIVALNATHLVFAATIAVAAFVAVVVLRYLVVRYAWVGTAACVAVATGVGIVMWPARAWVPAAPPEHHVERGQDVVVQFDTLTAGPAQEMLHTRFNVRGWPQEFALDAVGAAQSWRWPEGIELRRESRAHGGNDWLGLVGLKVAPPDAESQQWMAERARQRGFRWHPELRPAPAPGEAVVSTTAPVQASILERLQSTPPAYDARVWLRLSRPELRFEVPLDSSEWRKRDGYGVRIGHIKRGPEGAAIFLAELSPRPLSIWWSDLTEPAAWYKHLRTESDIGTLLIHRTRREVLETMMRRRGQHRGGDTVYGIAIEWRLFGTEAPRVIREGKPVPVTTWLDDATLVFVAHREVALFSRSLRVDGVRVQAAPTRGGE